MTGRRRQATGSHRSSIHALPPLHSANRQRNATCEQRHPRGSNGSVRASHSHPCARLVANTRAHLSLSLSLCVLILAQDRMCNNYSLR